MQQSVIFAGFGGQGVMLIGQMIAYSAMDDGKEVTWLPSYGPEMRGGTASCVVIVSDQPISSPVVSNPDACVAMNRPSLEKFGPTVKKGGFIFINSSLIDVTSGRKDVREILVPCNELAAEAGNPRSSNIVMVGALIEGMKIVSTKSVLGRIEYAFKKKGDKVLKINFDAFEKGQKVARS